MRPEGGESIGSFIVEWKDSKNKTERINADEYLRYSEEDDTYTYTIRNLLPATTYNVRMFVRSSDPVSDGNYTTYVSVSTGEK